MLEILEVPPMVGFLYKPLCDASLSYAHGATLLHNILIKQDRPCWRYWKSPVVGFLYKLL